MPRRRTIPVFADAGFYICLNHIDHLSLITSDLFEFRITNIVLSETGVANLLEGHGAIVERNFDAGPTLEGLCTGRQMGEGEYELIARASREFKTNNGIKVILDDDQARKFLTANFSEMEESMTWTVGFIVMCCCEYGTLTRDSALAILGDMGDHRKMCFHVPVGKLDEAMTRIREC